MYDIKNGERCQCLGREGYVLKESREKRCCVPSLIPPSQGYTEHIEVLPENGQPLKKDEVIAVTCQVSDGHFFLF